MMQPWRHRRQLHEVLKILERGISPPLVEIGDERRAVRLPIRLGVAAAVGVSVFVFALVAADSRDDISAPSVSENMLADAVPRGEGANVVNVILVDFRALDTFGEVAVVAVAAIAAWALLKGPKEEVDEK